MTQAGNCYLSFYISVIWLRRFADIGVPPRQGAAEVGSGATTDNWLSAAARMFPLPVQTAAKAAHNIDQELYAEAGNATTVLPVITACHA